MKKRMTAAAFCFLMMLVCCSGLLFAGETPSGSGAPPSSQAAQGSRGKKRDFRYIAVGNSITFHPVCDFWFYPCGMGATEPSKDFVHRTLAGAKKAYKKQYQSFSLKEIDAPAWEQDRRSREKTKKEIGIALKKKPQLLTFQYGEGCRNTYRLEQDLKTLVEYIRKKSPETKIVLVGNFWLYSNAQRQADKIKKKVAARYGIGFADLSSIAGRSSYQLGYTSLKDAHGNLHRVTHRAVARHPNNRGMAYIAGKVLSEYRRLVKKAAKAS